MTNGKISFPVSKAKAPTTSTAKTPSKDEHYDLPSKRLRTIDDSTIHVSPSSASTSSPSISSSTSPPSSSTETTSSNSFGFPQNLTREALKASKSRRVTTRLQKLNSRANDPFTVLPDNIVESIIRMLEPQDNARLRGVCKLWKAQVEYFISPGWVSKMFGNRKGFESVDRSDPRWAEKFYRKQSCCEQLQRSGKATRVWKFSRSVAWALCGERMVWIDGSDICVQHLQPWNEAERVRTLTAVAQDPMAVQKNKQLHLLLQDLSRGPSSRRLRPSYKNAHLAEPITVRFTLSDILKTRKSKIFINNVLGSKDGLLVIDYMQRNLSGNEEQGVSNSFMQYDYSTPAGQFQNKLACVDVVSGHAKWITNIDGHIQRRLAFMSPGVYWSRTRYSTGYYLIAGNKFVSFTVYTEQQKDKGKSNTDNSSSGGGGSSASSSSNTNGNNAGNGGGSAANNNNNATAMANIASQIFNMNNHFLFPHALAGNFNHFSNRRISLTVRDIETGKVVAEETCDKQYPPGNGYFERPTNFFADPAGKKVGAVLSKELFVYDVETAKCIRRIPLNHLADEHTYQFDVMFSNDGTKLHLTEERLGSDFCSYTLDCENGYKVLSEDRYRTPARINRCLKTVFSPRSQTAVFFRRNENRGEWHPEMAKFKPIQDILGPDCPESGWGREWRKRIDNKQVWSVDGPHDGWKLTEQPGSSQLVPDFTPTIFTQYPMAGAPHLTVWPHAPHFIGGLFGGSFAQQQQQQQQQASINGNINNAGGVIGSGGAVLSDAVKQARKDMKRTEYACVTRRAVTLPPSKEPSSGSSRKRKSNGGSSANGGSGGGAAGRSNNGRTGGSYSKQPTDVKLPNGRREFWITWRWGPQSIKFSDQYLVFDQEDTIFVCDFGPMGW